jgi:AcrR family transcriptional regulator
MATPETDGRIRRSTATRTELVKAARALFAERGYDQVSTAEVVAAAGVTRNALYYHFPAKEALFRAVYEDVEREVAERILPAATQEGSAVERLRKGCQLFLDACLASEIAEISVRQAPAVLGFRQVREIDNRHYLGPLQAVINAGIENGEVPPMPVKAAASMLLGALDEAALLIADSARPRQTRRDAGQVAETLIDGWSRQAALPDVA